MADDKVKVVIAFDPADRKREGKTVELEPNEAHNLVAHGRAQYADEAKKSSGSSGGSAANTNNAGS